MKNVVSRNVISWSSTLAIAFFLSTVALAQGGPVKPVLLVGEVKAIDSSSITVQTKDGSNLVSVNEKTQFKKVSPDNPTSLSSATSVGLDEIEVGDKVVVSVVRGADGAFLSARAVYLMSKSELAQKRAKEAERWARDFWKSGSSQHRG